MDYETILSGDCGKMTARRSEMLMGTISISNAVGEPFEI